MRQTLPDDFVFSQTSLQDWKRCRRRFQLMHLERVAYPAPETADQLDFEAHQERGDQFHRLVHQHLTGIDADIVARQINDEQVQTWWENYLAHGLTDVPPQRYAEVSLAAPLGDYRLVAKYDLIAAQPGERIVIVDWKTAQHPPQPHTLENRMQTVVYRYLLVEAGAYYNGGQPVAPEQVEMIYWFANAPTQPVRLPYSSAQHQTDAAHLAAMVREIATERDFPKVPESDKERVCRFCNYRSLCWENVPAGLFAEMDAADTTNEAADTDDVGFDIDLDQIAEIEF